MPIQCHSVLTPLPDRDYDKRKTFVPHSDDQVDQTASYSHQRLVTLTADFQPVPCYPPFSFILTRTFRSKLNNCTP